MICVEIQIACHGKHMCAQPQSLCIFLIYAAPTANEAQATESQQRMSILMTPCHRGSSSQDLAVFWISMHDIVTPVFSLNVGSLTPR